MNCKVCGGDLVPCDSGIPSDLPSCKCALQFLPSESGRRLHAHLFELQDAVSQLISGSGVDRRERDTDDHIMEKSQRSSRTLASAPRRNVSKIPRPLASSSAKPSRPQLSHSHQMNTNAIFNRMSRPHTALANNKSPTDIVNLQEIRAEITSLRQKFDEDLKVILSFLIHSLQDMRNVITKNVSQMTQLLKPEVVAESKIEGKENAIPESSILSAAHRAFLDAMKHRRAFETNVANLERSQAQKDVFDILEHLDDGDADVIRMRALLDDAVNNINIIPKPPQPRPKQPIASKAGCAHLDRLSAPKQQFKPAPAKRPTKLTVNQRTTPSVPKIASLKEASSSAGLADLVNFSPEESTTAPPLMRRPRVVLKSPPPQRVREKVVRFEKTSTISKSPTKPDESKPKSPMLFVPLGMRQYTMWPLEESQTLETNSMEHRLGGGNDRLSVEDIRNMLENALHQHLERQTSQLRVQDRDVATSRQDFTKEEALSPIPIPKKPTLIDASSSPYIPTIISCRESMRSIQRQRSSSLPSFSSEFTPISERPKSAHSDLTSSTRLSASSLLPVLPQSPIFSLNEEVPSPTTEREFESVQTVSGLSQTDPRSFSDGVWLDPDRSEGEYGGIPMHGIKQATAISNKLGPLPSLSGSVSQSGEEEKIHSEGEFTLDQVANQSGGWVAPWRDPLLHLIALDTTGETSKLPWNQQQKIEKVAALLDDRKDGREVIISEPDEIESSTADSLSWVKKISAARRARKQAEAPTPSTAEKSDGEVSVPTSVKEFRRVILARSSQRMRQRKTSVSDG
ncbi:unnamed protein product [Hymenolepis diminuta]|uniref:CARMIL_C domain-containing protein n=1 Tax=Hymenolepis diminuta TaxID=6216 RepID=A0A158QGB2_HYMDI|nr:unnamed protein product [Hymenolepis diminuta]